MQFMISEKSFLTVTRVYNVRTTRVILKPRIFLILFSHAAISTLLILAVCETLVTYEPSYVPLH